MPDQPSSPLNAIATDLAITLAPAYRGVSKALSETAAALLAAYPAFNRAASQCVPAATPVIRACSQEPDRA